MAKFLINSFSAGMLPAVGTVEVEFASTDPDCFSREELAEYSSAVGHADTAALFAAILGVPVHANRATVSLSAGDECLLGQYSGPRLPEGSTTLPAGASVRWLLVTLLPGTRREAMGKAGLEWSQECDRLQRDLESAREASASAPTAAVWDAAKAAIRTLAGMRPFAGTAPMPCRELDAFESALASARKGSPRGEGDGFGIRG